MRLKIVSDGTTEGTYVEHAETGERLQGVQLISWSASADDSLGTEATIHLWQVPCEITAKAGMMIKELDLEDNPYEQMTGDLMMDEQTREIDISSLMAPTLQRVPQVRRGIDIRDLVGEPDAS